MDQIFFNNWQSLGRTFIITILGYILMIFFLRISGKRTLSKMNAFDFIVTIALGSSLATVALNKNVPLAEGALVFFLLIFQASLFTGLLDVRATVEFKIRFGICGCVEDFDIG